MIAICSIAASFAQIVVSTSYLDRDYHPASERSYTFKRVITYKNQVFVPHATTDYYGTLHIDENPSGLHVCSLADYFASGEPALVANVISLKTSCDQWSFDGKVVYFYRSGRMRKTEFYKYGKLQGDVITYAEDGKVLTKDHYEGGQHIDERKYAVDADQPLVGKWKYVKYKENCSRYDTTCIESTLVWTISANGICDSRLVSQYQYNNWEAQSNWKYTSTGPATGVWEDHQGETLVERGNMRWISRNEIEYTVTFSPDPNGIGRRLRFVREWRDGSR
jgi:hypothetical protein